MSPVIFYNLLKEIGTPVIGLIIIFGLITIGSLLWKIMNNHLAHLASDVKEVLGKVTGLEQGFVGIKERVAFLEGRDSTKRVRKTKSSTK